MTIENISDTARWVAYYRAMESERPDAVFHDPFAVRLAGEKGRAIVEEMPKGKSWAWPMIVRTAVMDELVEKVVAAGADTVVNLAAGLDTRPWRMQLPSTLRWIEVDLDGILEYKAGVMTGEAPVCRHEIVAQDLRNREARRTLFARIGAESSRAAILTEGLLVYLDREEVEALARDLHDVPTFRWWIIDIVNPRVLGYMRKAWSKRLSSDAEFKFGPSEGTAFYEPLGWRESEFRSSMLEAHRLHREIRLGWLWRFLNRLNSAARREEFRRMSGVAVLDRT